MKVKQDTCVISIEGHLKPEDLVLEEGASEKTLRTLSKGNQAAEFYQTSSSRINSAVGSPGSSCKCRLFYNPAYYHSMCNQNLIIMVY